MYILPDSTEFNKACKAQTREIEVKVEVVNGAETVTMSGSGALGEIISIEWDNVINSSDGYQIGTCCMDEFKMRYHPVDLDFTLLGKELHPYIGLVEPHENTGDITEWVPLGIFYVVDSVTEDDGYTYSITAYDGMSMLSENIDFAALGISFPVRAWDLLEAIATKYGLSIVYDKLTYVLLTSEGYTLLTTDNCILIAQQEINENQYIELVEPLDGTYRDYVGWIAGLVGANAHMGRNGELVISRYKEQEYLIGRDVQQLGGAKINYNGVAEYTCIVSGTEQAPIYPTEQSGNAITYTNPFITQEALDLLNTEIFKNGNITITPCDVAWRGDPRLDVGDLITVEDKDGNSFPVHVMERVVKVTGGMSEELHCYGRTETVQNLSQSPTVLALKQVEQKIADAATILNTTQGTMRMLPNPDGTNRGYDIVEGDGVSWLRCTAGGIGISNDGGLTYANAITKNGVIASSLKVTNGTTTLLDADDGDDGDQVFLKMYHPLSEKEVFSVRAYPNSNAYQTMQITKLALSDANSGRTWLEMMSTYYPLQDTTSSYFAMRNINDNSVGIYMRAFNNDDQRDANIEFVTASNDTLLELGYADDVPYISMKDSGGTVRQMKIKSATISGTTIHYLGY